MDELIKILSKQDSILKKVLQSLKNMSRQEADSSKKISILNTEIKNINRHLGNLSLDPSIKAQIESAISAAKSELSKLEQTAKMEFGRDLNKILQEKGFVLEGNYPKLRTSVYTLVIDFLENKADLYYGPEVEKIGTCNPIAEEVASKIVDYHNKLTQREFVDEMFLKELYNAYNVCLLQEDKVTEDEVLISDILSTYAFLIQDKNFKKNPLKKYYSEYDRISFSYDLHRLKERRMNNFELKLITARRGETNNRLDFLWIPSSNEKGLGESVSRIKFSKV